MPASMCTENCSLHAVQLNDTAEVYYYSFYTYLFIIILNYYTY